MPNQVQFGLVDVPVKYSLARRCADLGEPQRRYADSVLYGRNPVLGVFAASHTRSPNYSANSRAGGRKPVVLAFLLLLRLGTVALLRAPGPSGANYVRA